MFLKVFYYSSCIYCAFAVLLTELRTLHVVTWNPHNDFIREVLLLFSIYR